MATISTVGISSGSLILRITVHSPAPSIRAASITSFGMFMTAPRKISTLVPRFFSTRLTTTLIMAQFLSVSQFGPVMPILDRK